MHTVGKFSMVEGSIKSATETIDLYTEVCGTCLDIVVNYPATNNNKEHISSFELALWKISLAISF